MGKPGSRGAGAASGSGAASSTWTAATAQRFQQTQHGKPSPYAKGVGEHPTWSARDLAAQIQEGKGGRKGVWTETPDGEEQDLPDMVSPDAALQAARQYHRVSSGMLATGFEPQRHSFYICGRPVQVPRQSFIFTGYPVALVGSRTKYYPSVQCALCN